ncbi:MAG: hypothetical protein RJA33_155 [Actinomycetota bacterium]|jgi:hypothetical protein
MQLKGRWALALAISALFSTLVISPSYAAIVTAAGDTAGLCTQTVSDATGVTVTKVGNDCVVQFTSATTLTWTPLYAISARYLVVGAGGSGTRGYCSYYWGQGGGGGEVLTGTGRSFSANTDVTITVAAATGRRGDCAQGGGADGASSVLGTLIARGGKTSLNAVLNNSGAVGGVSGNGNPGGIGTANGGAGCTVGNCQAGGGGGAGAAGSGKNGGAGVNSDIITLGTNVMYGSGGAGWAGTGDMGTASSGGGTPGTAACDAPANRGGGGADCIGHATTGGSGGSGLVVIRYTYNNPPTIGAFSSAATASYSSNENVAGLYSLTATDIDAGAALTYSLTGTDAGDFSISASGTLSFSPAPDFEAPTDADTNNTYIVVTWVSDGIYSDSQTVTITVLDLSEASTVALPSISGTATKGVNLTATVTLNVAGKVRFFIDGKRIATCLARPTTGNYPNVSATCTWKPVRTGRQFLTAQLTPTNNNFTVITSQPLMIWVVKRTTTR